MHDTGKDGDKERESVRDSGERRVREVVERERNRDRERERERER